MKMSSEIVIYDADEARVEVRVERETVWLTQEQIAQLFGRERSVVTKHIRNVFAEGELDREAVCAKFAHTASELRDILEHYDESRSLTQLRDTLLPKLISGELRVSEVESFIKERGL